MRANTQIFEEASDWLVEFRMEEATAARRREFQAWLDKSPEHVRAYLELVSVWEDSALLDRARAQDLDALIALSRSQSNVVGLHSSRTSSNEMRRRMTAIAASVALLGILGATGYWYVFERHTFTTDVGQQRTLALTDGTTVELNADTRVRERFTQTQRLVELVRGQALFQVAKNPLRPFIVASGDTRVRAVGTQFDVRRGQADTTVTVLEGSVAVEDSGRTASQALLSAGEQTTVSASAPVIPQRANVVIATAWTRQKLVFESATLAQAAEDFNRFNARKIVVDPEGLEDFRINGSFPALDPNSLSRFVMFLRTQPGLALTEEAGRVRVEKKR